MMRKSFLLLCFLQLTQQVFSQNIADVIFVLGADSVKMYYNKFGLTPANCATHYRLAKLSPDLYAFNGPFKDFYISGNIAVEGNYLNNLLDGAYISRYPNGGVKEQGKLQGGVRIGEWTEYYESGQLKRIIRYNSDGYYLDTFIKENGRPIVTNGNGSFKEFGLQADTHISGEIKNGLKDGKWIIYNERFGFRYVEYFNAGIFLKGKDINTGREYREQMSSIAPQLEDLFSGSYFNKNHCGDISTQVQLTPTATCGFSTISDYIYKNFHPGIVSKGFVLLGYRFAANKQSSLDISIYSTLTRSINKELSDLFSSCNSWKPNIPSILKQDSISNFVSIQFLGDSYKILNDGRNRYRVDLGARYLYGNDSLSNYILKGIALPDNFKSSTFNASTIIDFEIDRNGDMQITNSLLLTNEWNSYEERLMYQRLFEMLLKAGPWEPAYLDNKPVNHLFRAVFSIKRGIPTFRLLSDSWVVGE